MDILLGEMMKGLTQLILNMYRPIICSSTSLTCISYVVHEWISLSGFHRKYIVQRCRCRKHVFHFRCQDDIVFFYVFHKKSMNYRHRNDVRVPAGVTEYFNFSMAVLNRIYKCHFTGRGRTEWTIKNESQRTFGLLNIRTGSCTWVYNAITMLNKFDVFQRNSLNSLQFEMAHTTPHISANSYFAVGKILFPQVLFWIIILF